MTLLRRDTGTVHAHTRPIHQLMDVTSCMHGLSHRRTWSHMMNDDRSRRPEHATYKRHATSSTAAMERAASHPCSARKSAIRRSSSPSIRMQHTMFTRISMRVVRCMCTSCWCHPCTWFCTHVRAGCVRLLCTTCHEQCAVDVGVMRNSNVANP